MRGRRVSTGVDSGEPPASPFPPFSTRNPRTPAQDGEGTAPATPTAPPPPRHRPVPPPPNPATRLPGPGGPGHPADPPPRVAGPPSRTEARVGAAVPDTSPVPPLPVQPPPPVAVAPPPVAVPPPPRVPPARRAEPSPVPPAVPPPVPVASPTPGAPRRTRAVRGVVAVCVVLGLGLIGGAAAGAMIDHGPRAAPQAAPGSAAEFAEARQVWHSAPVDTLFPPTVAGKGAGPGGADREWTRVGIARPGGCTGAFDPLLDQVLAPVGCLRLLRATYVDSTSTTVTTVGLLVASGDAAGMQALSRRWTAEHLGDRVDLIPRPVAFPGTPAARFGPAQRGSWDVRVSADRPLVVYAVTGFADGRPVPRPQPASAATASGATTTPAQAGLGHDASGLAKAIGDRLTATVTAELHPTSAPGTEKHG